MKMIEHHNKCTKLGKTESLWQFQPFPLNDLTYRVELHLTTHLTKQTFSLPRDNCYKICAIRQSNRTPVLSTVEGAAMFPGIEQ